MPCPKRLRDEQDPDYPDDESQIEGKRQRLAIEAARADACDRVRRIVHKHFGDEMQRREETLMECQSRIHEATQALHLLRYVAVSAYYTSKATTQQARIHPAVKKLVGRQGFKNTMQLGVPDCSLTTTKSRNPLFKLKNDASEPSTSCQLSKSVDKDPSVSTKQPRYIAPKEKESATVSPPRASSHKVKKRLLVGNISKWLCEELREGAATHKWMMYVRGPPENPDISNLIEKVRFYLHASYQPHDVIEVTNAPFHLSRRGWGEFPVRLQIHFRNSENRPLDVIHQLRLDRTYTGLQTLGAETLVDVWLFDDQRPIDNIPSTSSIPPSLQPIKQEQQPSFTESPSDVTIKQEPQDSPPKMETSPIAQASRSLLKHFNVIKTHTSSASSSVKSVMSVKNEITTKESNTTDHVKVTKVSHNIKIGSRPQIITTSQANLARILCGQIKVEPGTSSNNISQLSDTPSVGVVKNDNKVMLKNLTLVQNTATTKPVNAIVINKDGEAAIKNVQAVSGSSLLKSNFRTINDLSLLQGKKIIQLTPVSNSSNQSKSITVSPKQGNQVISVNQNKTLQVLKSTSVLKSVPTNGVNNLTNGAKLMFAKSIDNKRVILVKMDKNGKLQQIPQNSMQSLTPQVVMIKRPIEPPKLVPISSSSQINTKQSESRVKPSITIERSSFINCTSKQVNLSPTNLINRNVILNKQQLVDSNNRGISNTLVAGNKIFTVGTSSGLNVVVQRTNWEEEKTERLVIDYEQQLRKLECRTVDDADLAMSLLLRQFPLIASRDDAYCRVHPYVIPSIEIFYSWAIGKQRAFEAIRASLVRRLLIAQGFPARSIWEIIRWARLHGFSPLPDTSVLSIPHISIKEERKSDIINAPGVTQDTSVVLSSYSEPTSLLSWLGSHVVDRCSMENEIIDVEAIADTSVTNNSKADAEVCNNENSDETDRQCVAVCNTASQLGIALNNQSAFLIAEVGKLLMEDLLRRALAESCKRTKGTPASIEASDVKTAILARTEFDIFSNKGLGMEPDPTFSQTF